MDEKYLPREASFRFRLSKPDGSDTYCYAQREVLAMLNLCSSECGLAWLANIIRVLCCTGLRISELAGLRWTDIDVNGNVIQLNDARASKRRSDMGTARRNKGKRSRMVPLHSDIEAGCPFRASSTAPPAGTDGAKRRQDQAR